MTYLEENFLKELIENLFDALLNSQHEAGRRPLSPRENPR